MELKLERHSMKRIEGKLPNQIWANVWIFDLLSIQYLLGYFPRQVKFRVEKPVPKDPSNVLSHKYKTIQTINIQFQE